MLATNKKSITPPNLMNMKRFQNLELINHKDQLVGKIQDYILSVHDLSVDYVVVSPDASLSIKDKLFIVPWSALRLADNELHFILPIELEELRNAPGYSSDWPDTPDQILLDKVEDFYRKIFTRSIPKV